MYEKYTTDEGYVILKDLAKELGFDRSNFRKYVLQHGFNLVKIRTPEARNQLTLAVSVADAESIRELCQKQGYGKLSNHVLANNEEGWFYVIQLVPELNPNRVKLGFTGSIEERLTAHRTSAPTAELVKCWSCKRSWERAAIDSITRIECKSLGYEVFECENLARLIKRADEFFAIMPQSSTSKP